MVFTATSREEAERARNTSPMAPAPSRRSTSYGPIRAGWNACGGCSDRVRIEFRPPQGVLAVGARVSAGDLRVLNSRIGSNLDRPGTPGPRLPERRRATVIERRPGEV